MKKIIQILLSFAIIAVFSGCAKLAKDGVYKGDSILYEADKTIVSAYDVLHSFVKFEYIYRSSLETTPEVRKQADFVRQNAERWIQSAIMMRDAYAMRPTPEGRARLAQYIQNLDNAAKEALTYLK